jgi:hypothetical protein
MARLDAKWNHFGSRGQAWYHFWTNTIGIIVTLQSETRNIISAIAGINTSHVVFRTNMDCDQWEARADGNGSFGSGLLVGSGGSISANQDVAFDVDNTELTNGDKTYPIDVFAHTAAGWSNRV